MNARAHRTRARRPPGEEPARRRGPGACVGHSLDVIFSFKRLRRPAHGADRRVPHVCMLSSYIRDCAVRAAGRALFVSCVVDLPKPTAWPTLRRAQALPIDERTLATVAQARLDCTVLSAWERDAELQPDIPRLLGKLQVRHHNSGARAACMSR